MALFALGWVTMGCIAAPPEAADEGRGDDGSNATQYLNRLLILDDEADLGGQIRGVLLFDDGNFLVGWDTRPWLVGWWTPSGTRAVEFHATWARSSDESCQPAVDHWVWSYTLPFNEAVWFTGEGAVSTTINRWAFDPPPCL